MNFIKSLFDKKETPINSYSDFWNWFRENEQKFYDVIRRQGNVNKVFFDKLAPKLNELKDGFWFLAGMCSDTEAELILTADGVIKNIVFVEELVKAAPKMKNWQITALKQPSDSNQFGIEMDGYTFDESSMSFYPVEHPDMPDEIEIVIAHKDYSEKTKEVITNGVFLALDNSLGELNSITIIDFVKFINPSEAEKELIPLEKLRDYLIWREKEFIEKYKGVRHDTENDNYSGMEATLQNGLPLLAVINTDLLNWDSKASHPWVAVVEIQYDGKANNGMPDQSTYDLLNEIEEKIMAELKDSDGYLNVGRQTANNCREIYFTCFDFRKPSKILYKIQKQYKQQIGIEFDIYKDKYWQTFNRFMPS
ncbi:DUF695 domain-containing protein [Ulvibacterium sp.]|uniref:DUF695 domain-containing protein n=1 Tax=Ulvibacterium sp. TaxID=2665914 RepID=UPI0026312678|nr:DUF695 domain-containing protein [Ulvibacterium sp.]